MPPIRRPSRQRTARQRSVSPGTWSGSTQHRRCISRLARSFTARPKPAASPAERSPIRRGFAPTKETEPATDALDLDTAKRTVLVCPAEKTVAELDKTCARGSMAEAKTIDPRLVAEIVCGYD